MKPNHSQNQARVETASLCEAGPVRSNNEDNIAIHDFNTLGSPHKGLMLVVSDGMGGRDKGEVASAMVTQELPDLYLNSTIPNCVEALVEAVNQVNQAVYARSAAMQMNRGMGATLVTCVLVNDCLITLNVGDSRAYILHEGALRQVSHDHSLRKKEIPFFETKTTHDLSHVLTQAIGPNPHVSPHVNIAKVSAGDTVLLCSDGLTSAVPEDEIMRILSNGNPAEAVEKLFACAVTMGADDNVSIIACRVLAIHESLTAESQMC